MPEPTLIHPFEACDAPEDAGRCHYCGRHRDHYWHEGHAPRPRRLFHYCCDHSVEGILSTARLQPNPGGEQPRLSARVGVKVVALPVIWMTDIQVATDADIELLGLGAHTGFVRCDRVAYRFRVPYTSSIEWWPAWADRALDDGRIEASWREALELDRAPERWWVCEAPIRGPQLDERYRRPSHPTPVA